jgi:hypothetical protein
MDVNTQPRTRANERTRARKLDGYTVHVLSRDGTITTVGKQRTDGTRKLTVEVRNRRGEREIPADIAKNLGSAEFERVVGDLKTRLLDRSKGRSADEHRS